MLGRMVRTVERHRHSISNNICPQESIGTGARKVHGKRYKEKGTTPTGKTQQKRREEGSGRGEGREGNGGYNALLGGRKSRRYRDHMIRFYLLHAIFGGKFCRYNRQYTFTYGLVYVHDDTLAVQFAVLGFLYVYRSYSVRNYTIHWRYISPPSASCYL